MDENINNINEVIEPMKGPIAIYSIIGIILLIVLFIFLRKISKKNKELSKREMTYYIDNAFNWTSSKEKPSGNIYCNGNSLRYSRGNRSTEFNIIISKDTFIAPCLIQDWFIGRNYNRREEEAILNDIKTYLEDNRYAKTVTIISDEEYELQFDNSENYNEY